MTAVVMIVTPCLFVSWVAAAPWKVDRMHFETRRERKGWVGLRYFGVACYFFVFCSLFFSLFFFLEGVVFGVFCVSCV